MGITRQDLVRSGRYLSVSDEEWQKELETRELVLKNYMANDEWAVRALNGKVGILITSHPGNRAYLKSCIESHKRLGFWITLAYDNHLDPSDNGRQLGPLLPVADVMHGVDLFLMPHHQTWGGVLYPWFWLMKWGTLACQQFEYIYCVNGDFILEKPEGFSALMEHMGDADIMSYYQDARSIGTCFIAKREALMGIMKHVEQHFVPFDVYEKYTADFGNAEARFMRAVCDLGLKLKQVDNPYNEQMHISGQGTWYDLVGFRHIHGEHNYAYRYGREKKIAPPHYKYMDCRFMGDEYYQIKQYWDNDQDISRLEDWWAR